MIKVENRTVKINGDVVDIAQELGLIIWTFKEDKNLAIALESALEAFEIWRSAENARN